MINSFSFLVAVHDDKIENSYIREFEDKLENSKHGYVKLENNGRLKLVKNYNIWLDSISNALNVHTDFMKKREQPVQKAQLVEFEISREEIEQKDFTRIEEFINSVTQKKDSVLEYYQSLIFHVSGYDNDPRELSNIYEVIEYFKISHMNYPELVWFMNIDVGFGFFSEYMVSNIIDHEEFKKSDNPVATPLYYKFFIMHSFDAINKLLNRTVIDNKRNSEFTSLFNDKTQQVKLQRLGISQ